MPIELEGLGENKVVQLDSCVELEWLSQLFSYINRFEPSEIKKNFFAKIDLQTPYRINPNEDKSIMHAKTGNRHKEISGQHNNLLALFVLAGKYQENGTMSCKYCKRTVPDQCQIVGFFKFLAGY